MEWLLFSLISIFLHGPMLARGLGIRRRGVRPRLCLCGARAQLWIALLQGRRKSVARLGQTTTAASSLERRSKLPRNTASFNVPALLSCSFDVRVLIFGLKSVLLQLLDISSGIEYHDPKI